MRGFEARLTVAHEELLVERKAVKHLRAECQSLAEKEARAGKEVHYLESLMQQYEGQLVRLEAREAGLMAALRSLVVGVTIWSYVHHRRNCLLLLRQGAAPPRGVRALGFLGGSTEVGAPKASEATTAAEKVPRRPVSFADFISDEETCVKIGHLDESVNALGDAEDYVDEDLEEEEEVEKMEEMRAKEVEAKEEEEEKMRVLLERLVAEEEQFGQLGRRLAAMEEAAAAVGHERAEMGAREQRALARIEELEEAAAVVGRERAELGVREQRALARIEELEESLANVRSELELVSINLGKYQVKTVVKTCSKICVTCTNY